MELGKLLFSFRGRVHRAKYWLVALIMILAIIVLAGIAGVLGLWLLLVPIIIAAIVSGFAIGVKRLHDRDKSAWWLVPFYVAPGILQSIADFLEKSGDDVSLKIIGIGLYLISLALSIWAFVELGCLRGTVGPNQYGPDPLEGRG